MDRFLHSPSSVLLLLCLVLGSCRPYHHISKPVCSPVSHPVPVSDPAQPVSCSYDEDIAFMAPSSLYEARSLFADTLRILAALQLDEGVDGHMTMRVPFEWISHIEGANASKPYFLVDRIGVGWATITYDRIVLIDPETFEILTEEDGLTGHIDWRAAVWMNGPLHDARPDLSVILHVHSPWTRAFSALANHQDDLPMIDQNSMRFYKRLGFVDYPGIVLDKAKAKTLADPFRDHSILILKNHGAIYGAGSLPEVLSLAYFLERVLESTYRSQTWAASSGSPLTILEEDLVVKTAKKLQGQAEKLMAHFLFAYLAERHL